MTELQTIIYNLKHAIMQGDQTLRQLLEEEEKGPEPHKWKHGDVFKTNEYHNTMIYLYPHHTPKPKIFYVAGPNEYTIAGGSPEEYLDGATFLFNIKEKL